MSSKINSILALAGIVLLSGCGSSSSTSTDTSTTTILSGITVDGYISNATVCIDLNNNKQCDSDEPSTTTDTNGAWSLTYDSGLVIPDNARIIALDGVDTFTNESFSGVLQAPVDLEDLSIVMSPLTTLIAQEALSNSSIDIETATTTISGILEIDSSDISQDPVSLAENDSTKSHVYQKALQIQNIIDMGVSTANYIDVLNSLKTNLKNAQSVGGFTSISEKINYALDNMVNDETISSHTSFVSKKDDLKTLITSIETSFENEINIDDVRNSFKTIQLAKHNEIKTIISSSSQTTANENTTDNTTTSNDSSNTTDTNSDITLGTDSTPEQFDFGNMADKILLSTNIENSLITNISGFDNSVEFLITPNAEYKLEYGVRPELPAICDNIAGLSPEEMQQCMVPPSPPTIAIDWTSQTQTFTPVSDPSRTSYTVHVRHTTSANKGEKVTSTLTVGGVSASFSSTTSPYPILDSSFDPFPYSFAVDNNGKYLLNSDKSLLRLNSDGSPDTFFGTNGEMTLTYRVRGDIFFNPSFDSSGNIFLSKDDGGYGILKVTSSGSMDSNFSNNGVLGRANITPINVYSGGLYLIDSTQSAEVTYTTDPLGFSMPTPTGRTINTAYLKKYSSNSGDFNTSFAQHQVFTSYDVTNKVNDILVQSDGKIVTISQLSSIEIKRFNTDGSTDTSFGTNGVFSYNPQTLHTYVINSISIGLDNSIYITYNKWNDSTQTIDDNKENIIKISDTGILDTSFGTNGVCSFDYDGTDSPEFMLDNSGTLYYTDNEITGGNGDIMKVIGSTCTKSQIIPVSPNGGITHMFRSQDESKVYTVMKNEEQKPVIIELSGL